MVYDLACDHPIPVPGLTFWNLGRVHCIVLTRCDSLHWLFEKVQKVRLAKYAHDAFVLVAQIIRSVLGALVNIRHEAVEERMGEFHCLHSCLRCLFGHV